MWLTYGDVLMQMCRVYRWENRAVKSEDGLDYLHNHVVLGVQAVLHPAATRSNLLTGVPVINGFGQAGAISYRDLRTYMMQPRRRLEVRVGDELILESPQTLDEAPGNLIRPTDCDVRGGPQPLDFRVLQTFGNTKTLLVAFEVETWVNDYLNFYNGPYLLSHRWTVREGYDQLGFCTRTTTGRAVFRQDFLRSHDANPADAARLYADDFRHKFHHPLPDDFLREGVEVAQSSDGATLDYTFRDVQQPTQLAPDGPVRRVTGRYVVHDSVPTMFWYANRRVSFTLEAWGRPGASRQALVDFIARVAASFGFTGAKGSPRNYHSRTWDVDLFDLRVRAELSVDVGGFLSTFWTDIARNVLDFPNKGPFPADVSAPDLVAG